MARTWILLLAVLAGPWPADAQDPPAGGGTGQPFSRAEALVARRAAREQALHRDVPTRLERLLTWIEESHIIDRLNPPEGFYPVAGGIVRGSAMGLGLGYRRRPAGGRVLLDTSAAWTYRGYRSLQVAAGLPSMGRRPMALQAGVRWFDYPQEDFFGLGRNTMERDRVSFTLRGTDTHAQFEGRKARWLVARARAGILRYDLGRGRDNRFPSIEALFTDADAPGLAGAPTLGYAESSLGIDTRDQPDNTRSGGLYALSLGAFRDTAGDYAFNRIDVKLMQVFPIFDKKRGIALHALASRVDPVGTARAPFFLMPTVGGNDSLRGFRDFRFRDAAALNLNAEYRWEAFSGLDLALFLDAGDVGPTWHSIVGAHLRSSWGVGFRFNTNRRVFLRLDVAGGREGPRIWAALGPVFRR